MMTVGQQGGSILPWGMGIGPLQLGWLVASPMRAAAKPLIETVAEPICTIPGPPGTQEGNEQGTVLSLTRAAASPPIITVGEPETIANGIGGWGMATVTGPAG
jgi:hypothetical protein